MHEIVTLQLGERSNYAATHFWNVQESYFTYGEEEESPVDHNVHFRPGLGPDGTETFTPRNLIYDLKGGFGNLRKHNALYEVENQDLTRSLWDGSEAVQRQPSIPQNEYQKSLEQGLQPPQLTSDAVRYWSDFNRVFYHPKSIVQLNEYELNSQLMPFEDWALGEELFNSLDKEQDILDRDFRPFAEESDQLRAIQIYSGADDAWGGFAARYIDNLRDEFGKKDIWVWALESGLRTQRSQRNLAKANSARTLCEVSPQVSAYIPIIDPPQNRPSYVTGDMSSQWYSSALLSMAAESISLPTRLRQYNGASSWLADIEGSRKIFNLQCKISSPGSEITDGTKTEHGISKKGYPDDYDASQELLNDFDIDFSPLDSVESVGAHVFTQARMSRDSEKVDNQAAEGSTSGAQHDRQMEDQPNVQRFHSKLGYPVLDSFPHDLVVEEYRGDSTLGVKAALSATTKIGKQIKGLRSFVGRMTTLDERETMVNGLAEIEENYQNRWESDSESEDD